MASTFQLHVLRLHWRDLGTPYTMKHLWPQLANADLHQAAFVFAASDIDTYDWKHQEMWLTPDATKRLGRTAADSLVRNALGQAFVVTLDGQRLYGGLFYSEGGAAAIRFPVIHALGEPVALLRIRPRLGPRSASDDSDVTEHARAIANPALEHSLSRDGLIRSVPLAERPSDPWAREPD